MDLQCESCLWQIPADLFFWLELELLQLLDLSSKDSLWWGSRVDAGSFYGNDKEAAILQKVIGIHPNNTGLQSKISWFRDGAENSV